MLPVKSISDEECAHPFGARTIAGTALLLCLPILTATAMLLAGAPRSGAQAPEVRPLSFEVKITLGDVRGRIDHMAIDLARNRLFVAELGNDTVGVVDLSSGQVIHRIRELHEPQGVGYEPSADALYVANGGDGSVRMYQAGDFKETGRIALGDDADNVRVDPAANRVLVGFGGGAIAAIDAVKKSKSAAFAVPAHPEGFQLDRKTNRIFVNVPRSRAVVVLDAATGRQTATWPMTNAGGNFAMAFDDDAQRVLVAFRAPARLGAFSAVDGRNMANVDLCGDADDVFVDSKRHRAYVSCGQGFIDVFDIQDARYSRSARIPTVPGARTSYFEPSSDRLFVAARATSSEPAAIWVFRAVP
jgi:DNA-binding beta-propeller fold protein YncE